MDLASSFRSLGREAPGVLVEGRRVPGAPLHFALTAGPPGALVQRGRTGHHGGWLEWFG